jgi:hypothetical protein
MAAKLIDTKQDLKLASGESLTRSWNRATGKAVYSANAVPRSTGSTTEGFDQVTQLEVTRLWRKYIFTEKSNDFEHEIWYTVKNVGNDTARFNVYLSEVS